MSPRVYERKFDYDEARRLRASGLSVRVVAERLGVSETAVQLATNDRYYAARAAYHAQRQRSGVCVDCGGPATRRRVGQQSRCAACAAKAATTSVRPTELRCSACREWKPDREFCGGGRAVRRGRSGQCRDCQTKAKARYRKRHQVPCSTGCGATVYEKERRDPSRPPLCRSCYRRSVA